jgi:hypothetical protein
MKQKIAVFCDFDGPIFHADTFLVSLQQSIAGDTPQHIELFNSLYQQHKGNIPTLISAIADQFHLEWEYVHNLFFSSDIQSYIDPESIGFLSSIQKIGTLEIVTKGDSEFQTSKLQRVHLKGTVLREKDTYLAGRIIDMSEKGNRCYIIDDTVKELQLVFDQLPEEVRKNVVWIQMKVGRHKNKGKPTDELLPLLHEVHDFSEITDLIQTQDPELIQEIRDPFRRK